MKDANGYDIPRKVIRVRPDLMPGEKPKRTPVVQQKRSANTIRPVKLPPEPTMREMAENFGKAMVNWVESGFPIVSEAEYKLRGSICETRNNGSSCEFWTDGFIGRCKAPGCGCTKLKRWLASEQCKHPDGSKWPAVTRTPATQPPAQGATS